MSFIKNTLILICIILSIICITQTVTSYASEKELVEVVHTVKDEALWNVAEKYCPPDRDIREFQEGIYENNYESVFRERERAGTRPKTVKPGDVLHIRFYATVTKD